jgi:hypothetical protein
MYEQYTDKQIVEMLKPKLAKLGWGNVVNNDLYPDTCKMIATIYRSAYIRGQLGRSFIIGEPKQTEHWVPATKDNVKIGDKVRYLNAEKHEQNPEFYPLPGTIGEADSDGDNETCLVQWPDYKISWYALWSDLEVLLCE